ncbi:uncharacterized protein LOC101235491 [Hydra vulgaris]|uniref:uncharacterized protein LOC101235491 n=1 Tax=Hydra vulgaris TaxID=6087 RepID=UPI001F5E8B3C|nr:uncharacterized protein LOC101235491 [Hydra vulgaris]
MTLFCIILWIGVLGVIHAQTIAECSDAESSCARCLQNPACTWCNNVNGGSCIPSDTSSLFCPEQSYHIQCPSNENSNNEKLENIFQLLSNLKSFQSQPKPKQFIENSYNFNADSEVQEKDTSSTSELTELLHKLMLLKLLRKLKQSGGSLSDDERTLLIELTNSSPGIIKTTAITPRSLKSIISQPTNEPLLHLINDKENDKTIQISTAISNFPDFSSKIVSTPSSVMSERLASTVQYLYNEKPLLPIDHYETVNVDYSESENNRVFKVNKLQTLNSFISEKENVNIVYCPFIKESKNCNIKENCTWCNTMDSCISRTSNDYKLCVESKSKMTDGEFGLDTCLSLSSCKKCVSNEKCYWCEQSKSCHTYPFFGFLPQSCEGDWYVKQCDVQLAVVVIVLPLMIILIALITFYFCLKYCYYRKKVLRVPLFEKPGVFDYRKDKKVYYVNPDDESSTDEFAAEKFRKKFRLPMEREPLIDPNT